MGCRATAWEGLFLPCSEHSPSAAKVSSLAPVCHVTVQDQARVASDRPTTYEERGQCVLITIPQRQLCGIQPSMGRESTGTGVWRPVNPRWARFLAFRPDNTPDPSTPSSFCPGDPPPPHSHFTDFPAAHPPQRNAELLHAGTRGGQHKSAERNLARHWPKRPEVPFCHRRDTEMPMGGPPTRKTMQWSSVVRQRPPPSSDHRITSADSQSSLHTIGNRDPLPPGAKPQVDRFTRVQQRSEKGQDRTIVAPISPCVTFRLVAVSLRGPGQSPVLPFACCVGSLRFVGRCGRCSCWCCFHVRGAKWLVYRGCVGCGRCRLCISGAQSWHTEVVLVVAGGGLTVFATHAPPPLGRSVDGDPTHAILGPLQCGHVTGLHLVMQLHLCLSTRRP